MSDKRAEDSHRTQRDPSTPKFTRSEREIVDFFNSNFSKNSNSSAHVMRRALGDVFEYGRMAERLTGKVSEHSVEALALALLVRKEGDEREIVRNLDEAAEAYRKWVRSHKKVKKKVISPRCYLQSNERKKRKGFYRRKLTNNVIGTSMETIVMLFCSRIGGIIGEIDIDGVTYRRSALNNMAEYLFPFLVKIFIIRSKLGIKDDEELEKEINACRFVSKDEVGMIGLYLDYNRRVHANYRAFIAYISGTILPHVISKTSVAQLGMILEQNGAPFPATNLFEDVTAVVLGANDGRVKVSDIFHLFVDGLVKFEGEKYVERRMGKFKKEQYQPMVRKFLELVRRANGVNEE